MSSDPKVVFVGQGPNRTAWERGLEAGRRTSLLRDGELTPENERETLRFAERYCSLLALTGSVGTKIGALLDVDVGTFWRRHERRNLNARWHGKSGKGDAFHPIEGRLRAREIEREDFTHFVLVGSAVAKCFDVRCEPLEVKGPTHENPRRYFLLPHPSGIVLWWNEPFNLFRAKKRLREFLTNQ